MIANKIIKYNSYTSIVSKVFIKFMENEWNMKLNEAKRIKLI